MPAVKSERIAIPARITLPVEPRLAPDQAIEKTSAAASSPKASAPTGSSAIEPGKRMMIRIAPKPAPPVTPITSGEASGLASAPCRIAPAIPSAAPTTIASTVRGRRSVSTICWLGPPPPLPRRMSITSAKGTLTAPSASEATTAIASAASSAAKTRVRRAKGNQFSR